MKTLDERVVRAPPARVFALAADVERWPRLLPHYRWVRLLERRPDGGIVEMAAWRPFGPLRWPTWWVSEMWIARDRFEVRYRHVQGITRGMEVLWRLVPRDGGTHVAITHEWEGPAWPLVGGLAAEWIIGPIFIHGIASRTLAGIGRCAEAAGAERLAP